MSIQRKGSQGNKGNRSKNRAHDSPEGRQDTFERARGKRPGEIECIENWLNEVRFKKVTFGGVSEADVWKKISELNEMYETALTAERARYDMLLKTCAKRDGRQAVRRSQDRSPVLAVESTEDISDEIGNVSLAARSRDAPVRAAESLNRRSGSEMDASKVHSGEAPEDAAEVISQRNSKSRQMKALEEGPAVSGRRISKLHQREFPEEKNEEANRRNLPTRRKSAKPSGAPYIQTDWLDDDEEENMTVFDIESNLRNSSRT